MSEEITPEEAPVEDVPTETPETEIELSVDLGDAGKKAIDAMKSKWHSERDKRRAIEAELEQFRTAAKPADETTPDADAIRAEAAREATAKANARILKSEIKAAAAGKLANPAVALKLIDLDQFEVDENGDVDADEITDAINTLIENEPYLAAATAPRFQGTGDGGAARKASGPAQLTRDELSRMSPQAIVQAKAEGRLKTLMSGE